MLVAASIVVSGEKEPNPVIEYTVALTIVKSKTTGEPAIRGIVKNTGNEVIEVPDGYDGRSARMFGRSKEHRWDIQLHPWEPRHVHKVAVQAGEERIVFELPLDEILLRPVFGDIEVAKPAWRWDWIARSAAPLTPFHEKSGGNRLIRRAEFWAVVDVDGRPVASKKLSLELGLNVVPSVNEK